MYPPLHIVDNQYFTRIILPVGNKRVTYPKQKAGECYIVEADKFEKWYGGLYIGSPPGPERNAYPVICLNFAVGSGKFCNCRESPDAHCKTEFHFFCDVYAASETVQSAIGNTTLHKIVVVYRGMDMEVCEEIG